MRHVYVDRPSSLSAARRSKRPRLFAKRIAYAIDGIHHEFYVSINVTVSTVQHAAIDMAK